MTMIGLRNFGGTMAALEGLMECAICADTFTEPRTLPCIHTFCLKCLEGYALKMRKGPGMFLPCPLCRRDFAIPGQGLSGLPKNCLIQPMMEMVNSKGPNSLMSCEMCTDGANNGAPNTASQFCPQCDKVLCHTCCWYHGKLQDYQDHELLCLSVEGTSTEPGKDSTIATPNCQVHGKEHLSILCFVCKSAVCVQCFVKEHRQHKCAAIKDVTDSKKRLAIVESLVDAVKAETNSEKLEKERLVMLQEIEGVRNAVVNRQLELIQKIEISAQVVLEELKAYEAEVTEKYSRNAAVEEFQDFCEKQDLSDPNVDVCRLFLELFSKAKGISQRSPTEIVFVPSNLEDFLRTSNITGELKKLTMNDPSPETKPCLKRKPFPDSVEHIKNLKLNGGWIIDVTAQKDFLYILSDCPRRIHSLEVRGGEWFHSESLINEIESPQAITSCAISDSLYIADLCRGGCIWKKPLSGFGAITPLLFTGGPFSVCVSDIGLLVVLKSSFPCNQLQIYSCEGKLIQDIVLPGDIQSSTGILQTKDGHFVISHRDPTAAIMVREVVVSKVSMDGQILGRLRSDVALPSPHVWSLDVESSRLFVGRRSSSLHGSYPQASFCFTLPGFHGYGGETGGEMMVFNTDSLEQEKNLCFDYKHPGMSCLYFDEKKNQLIVGLFSEVKIYQLN